MIAHLKAVEAFLARPYPVHLIHAELTSVQYLILSAPGYGADSEPALHNTLASFAVDIRVKAVAGTAAGVGIMLAGIRAVLAPTQAGARVPMDGRVVWTQYVRSEFVDVDEDLTLPNTRQHPFQGVDTYRLTSQPVPPPEPTPL